MSLDETLLKYYNYIKKSIIFSSFLSWSLCLFCSCTLPQARFLLPSSTTLGMTHLLLSDGTVFQGEAFGSFDSAQDDTFGTGEVVFNTGMAGYPESMTDPSYRGQILVTTYPLIGNYGVPSEELNEWGFSKNFESEEIHIRGLVVAQVSDTYSHHSAVSSLQRWMEHHKIPGITGVDTRALTKHLREKGVMLGRITHDSAAISDKRLAVSEIEDPNSRNLVAEVSCKEPITYNPKPETSNEKPVTILSYDCGMKRNILRSFLRRGVKVIRVPWDYDLDSCKEHFDGVFISNGPGDPKTCVPTIKAIKRAIEKNIPTFGICLGNQLMALAVGGDTFKLPYGHRGVNQPCLERRAISDKRQADSLLPPAARYPLPAEHHCIITSQNHGFAVDEKSLPAGWHVWWKNGNDGTVEGIRHDSGRFFAVQFHPEAAPGPEDAGYLFDQFIACLKV